MTNGLDYKNFETTGIDGVSVEQFVDVIEKLKDLMELEQEIHFDEDESNATANIMYRDSANYKYPFALQLSRGGEVLIVEPEWYQDEDEEKDLFWSILREYFGVTSFDF